MAPLTSAPVFGLVAHGVHYALVVGGLVAVGWLFVASSRPHTVAPRTPFEHRVATLRAAAEHGRLGMAGSTATAVLAEPSGDPPQASRTAPLALTGALVSSAAAAGVHAAASPPHFEAGLLVGGFFVATTIAQLAWVLAVLVGGTSAVLLTAGLVGNAAIVAVWVVTRTVGLPLAVTGVEPVGTWDTAASAWELLVCLGCGVLLARAAQVRPDRLSHLRTWSTTGRVWLVVSVLALGILSLTGSPQ